MDESAPSPPKIAKWPFFLGDGGILGVAVTIFVLADKPFTPIAATAIVMCGVISAFFMSFPYVIDYLTGLQVTRNHYKEAVSEQSMELSRVQNEAETLAGVLTKLAQNLATSVDRTADLAANLDEKMGVIDLKVEQAERLYDKLRAEHLSEGGNRADVAVSGADSSSLSSGAAPPSGVTSPPVSADIEAPSDHDAPLIVEAELDMLELESTETVAAPDGTVEGDSGALSEVAGKSVARGRRGKAPGKRKGKAEIAKDDGASKGTASMPVENSDEDLDETIPTPEAAPASRAPFKIPAERPREIRLVANVNIGIGNTPFVRGEGPGLNWTEGVPMTFIEIGKWEWKTEEGDAAAHVRIFKNDKISACGDDIEIGVGEQVEVFPKFPES